MRSWREWIDDWRSIAEAVPEGAYASIALRVRDVDYEVLRVSAYDAEIDGHRRMVQTASRRFDDKVALFSRITRDTGLVRAITLMGKRRFVIESGGETLEWVAALEGVSVKELALVMRDGVLWRRIARQVKTKKSLELLQQVQEVEFEHLANEFEDETNRIRAEQRALERERQAAKPK